MNANDHQDQLELLPPIGNVKTDETGFGGFGTMLLVQIMENFGASHRVIQYHFRILPMQHPGGTLGKANIATPGHSPNPRHFPQDICPGIFRGILIGLTWFPGLAIDKYPRCSRVVVCGGFGPTGYSGGQLFNIRAWK